MKKQKLLQAVLVVIIIIALGIVAKQIRPRASTSPTTYDRIMVDTKANKVFIQPTVVSASTEIPAGSPFSQGKNAYPAFQCVKDGTVFAYEEPAPSTDVNAAPMGPRCPVCGSSDVMPPQLPAGQKSMDVSGPVQVVKPNPSQ